MSTPHYIWFILNPASGTGKNKTAEKLIRKALKEGVLKGKIVYTRHSGHATEIALQAARESTVAVAAVGGDGTVHEIAKGLINTKTALAIVPTGSGNGMARHLGIPMNTGKALEIIRLFQTRTIDTAEINDKPFIGIAGVGFDAHIGWKFADFGKRGFWNYVRITTNEFFKYPSRKYELVLDGKKMTTEAFLIAISNSSQYGNNAYIAPDAELDDGLLEVSIVRKMPLAAIPGFTFRLFNKQLKSSQYLSSFRAKEIIIKQPDTHVHLDGEPKEMKKTLNISIRPKSLSIIC